MMQSRTEKDFRARIIAANNILNALFMVVASLMAAAIPQKAACRFQSCS